VPHYLLHDDLHQVLEDIARLLRDNDTLVAENRELEEAVDNAGMYRERVEQECGEVKEKKLKVDNELRDAKHMAEESRRECEEYREAKEELEAELEEKCAECDEMVMELEASEHDNTMLYAEVEKLKAKIMEGGGSGAGGGAGGRRPPSRMSISGDSGGGLTYKGGAQLLDDAETPGPEPLLLKGMVDRIKYDQYSFNAILEELVKIMPLSERGDLLFPLLAASRSSTGKNHPFLLPLFALY
jgi:hypothetical protein